MIFLLNTLKTDNTIVLWGIFMHLLVLWGVMDVNFHSPIIPDLSPVPLPKGAPAKRVFLFVADGLRHRTFINNPPSFIRKIMFEEGVWGISHTRVPTESRPGNIAIAAGLYEDPSAIFKGWKENPVNFDSVFNQSRATYAWGSPDIISVFTKDGRKNVHGKSYPAEWQEFQKSSTKLDEWVFNEYYAWLDAEASEVKDKDKIILFFHLLGCDTAGHVSKPNSREYLENIKYVDRMIEKVVNKTEQYFEPGTTSYIFTSDHGMTDWGSHGSGSMDETETPFVGWGAGFRTDPRIRNMNQADITPLISVLAGITIPVNNEGVLPLHFLNFEHTQYGAYAFLTNAKQLSIQVTANRIMSVGMSSTSVNWREDELNNKINHAENLAIHGNIEGSLKESQEAIVMAKEYLLYFRRYYRSVFLTCLTITWLSWISLLILRAVGKSRPYPNPFWLLLNNIVAVAIIILLFLEHIISGYQNFRWIGYGSISVFSFWLAVRKSVKVAVHFNNHNTFETWVAFFGVISLTILMYLGLMFRWVFSIGMLLATAIQIYFLKTKNLSLFISGIALSIFPLLPVVEPKPRIYIVLLSLLIGTIVTLIKKDISFILKCISCTRLFLTMIVCMKYVQGLTWISWLILITTPFVIPMHPKELRNRIQGIVINCLCPLALLSASYEPLFYLTLAVHLLSWPLPIYLKNNNKTEIKRLNIQDITKASFLMFYILLSFFGTGNMASISSFDPSWTHNFVTVFSPFTMTSLIVLKIIIPMILVGCLSRAFSSSTVFLSSLLLGDCIAFLLIFDVTPYGSWLDIGSAISRFTIAIILSCFLLLLHWISYPLLTLTYKQLDWRTSKKPHFG